MTSPSPSFVALKTMGTSPLFNTLIDTSDFSSITSATDYLRLWQITNDRTSAIYIVSANSSNLNYEFDGILGDTFSVSMSACF